MILQPSIFPNGLKQFVKPDDTDQRYTPKKYIDLVQIAVGLIGLDPVADPTKRVPARHHMTALDDCLSVDWVDFCGGKPPKTIFMNPPYSNSHPFITRLVSYLVANPEAIAITLTLSSLIQTQTSQPNFREHARAICLPDHRINFDYPAGMKPSSGNNRDVCFTYWGNDRRISDFYRVFCPMGLVVDL